MSTQDSEQALARTAIHARARNLAYLLRDIADNDPEHYVGAVSAIEIYQFARSVEEYMSAEAAAEPAHVAMF